MYDEEWKGAVEKKQQHDKDKEKRRRRGKRRMRYEERHNFRLI